MQAGDGIPHADHVGLCYPAPAYTGDRMRKQAAVRIILVAGLILSSACAPRLDEEQARARIVQGLHLQNDQLRVRSITRDSQPIVSIDYGGAAAKLRFRYQDGVWVVDAVERDGRWEPADQGLRTLERELPEKARALQMAELMPRYARTLRLLTGWSTLLSAACDEALPSSQGVLMDLHAATHRSLFKNRGGEFHDADLFVRDAWWKALHVSFATERVDVQSSGADGRMDTADDLKLTYTRTLVRQGIHLCLPHFTMPAWVADALGRPDAPKEWNCEDLMNALKKSGQLELTAPSPKP